MKLHFLLILGLLIIVSSCKKNTPTQPPDDLIFPLQIGNRWQYSRSLTTFNIRGNIPDSLLSDFVTPSTSSLEIVRMDTLSNSVETFVFHETVTVGSLAHEGEVHYNNLTDGLYLYAFSGANSTVLKSAANRSSTFYDRYFSNFGGITSYLKNIFINRMTNKDSLFIFDSPFKSLQYPLEIGQQWIYGIGSSTKKIVGIELVQVAAGTFNCFKIEWNLDSNVDIEFVDYICADGLIKRTMTFKDLVITAPNNPEPLGFFDTREDIELTNFQLN